MPHVTDKIYLLGFAARTGVGSIHVDEWPDPSPRWASSEALRDGEALVELAETVRRWKSERRLSAGAPLASLEIRCSSRLAPALAAAEVDLRSLTRAAHIEIVHDSEDAVLEVLIER
jgi:valyl-tRNA synthetase